MDNLKPGDKIIRLYSPYSNLPIGTIQTFVRHVNNNTLETVENGEGWDRELFLPLNSILGQEILNYSRTL